VSTSRYKLPLQLLLFWSLLKLMDKLWVPEVKFLVKLYLDHLLLLAVPERTLLLSTFRLNCGQVPRHLFPWAVTVSEVAWVGSDMVPLVVPLAVRTMALPPEADESLTILALAGRDICSAWILAIVGPAKLRKTK
jgi:hypothetical protein